MENEMLRKAARFVVPLAAGALLATAGCNVGADDSSDDNGGGGEMSSMTMGTGSLGGDYYGIGSAIAQMWSSEIDGLRVSAEETGASVENITKINNGELQLGLAVNGTATGAVNGAGDFEGVEVNIQVMGNLYPEVMQVVARADADIATIEDLDGKRVAIGPDGSGTQGLALRILEAAGVEPAETFADSFGDASSKLRDGQIDAAFGILSVPAASLQEAAQSVDLNFVAIPDDISSALMSADPTLSTHEIADGAYEGIAEGTTTVSNWATMYVAPGLNDDQVYEMTKALYESTGSIEHSLGGAIELENALEGVVDIDIHPGALRYYEEVGLR
jgi:uncharacterized protein